jgi:hypothetical protein
MAPLEAPKTKNQPDISRPVELEASRGYGVQAGWNRGNNPAELYSAIPGQGVAEFIEVVPPGILFSISQARLINWFLS